MAATLVVFMMTTDKKKKKRVVIIINKEKVYLFIFYEPREFFLLCSAELSIRVPVDKYFFFHF